MKRFQTYLIPLSVFIPVLLAALYLSPVWYDDAGHWLVAREFTENGSLCYPVDKSAGVCDSHSPFITMGPVLAVPGGWWMQIFGTEMVALRWMMIFFAVGCMIVFLRLTKESVGAKKALWAGLIVAGNIQFVTYGAQFMGEVPMILWMLSGVYFMILYLGKGRMRDAVLAWFFWQLAILVKAYIAVPVGLALIGILITLVIRKIRKKALTVILMGLALPLGTVIWLLILHEWSRESIISYLNTSGSYSSEFFSFHLKDAFLYSLWKPVIWMGVVAMLVKVWAWRDIRDIFIFWMQLFLWIFFFMSEGYDRLGMILIFLPAIYLSEYMEWLYVRIRRMRMRIPAMIAFFLAFLALFTQRTIPVYAQRLASPEAINIAEKKLAAELKRRGISKVYTYDQQIISFLPEGMAFRLSATVPSNAENCRPLQLKTGEFLVAGEYARTEFPDCWDESRMEVVFEVGEYVVMGERVR